MRFAAAVAAAVSLGGLAACAADPQGPAGAKFAAGDPDRMVCRKEQPLGSMRVERVCRTAREWEAARDSSKEGLDRMNPMPAPPSSKGGE